VPRREITDLREERAGLAERLRTIIDTAEQENRDLSAEEQQDYDRTEEDFDSLTARVKRLEKEGGLHPVLSREQVADPEQRDGRTERPPFAARVTAMDAFNQYLHARGQMDLLPPESRKVLQAEFRAPYAVGADATGAVTVPEDWSAKLVEVLTQFGVVERLADSIQTVHNGQLHIDAVVEPGTAVAAIVAEGGPYVETEDTFAEILLDAYKYGHLAKASDEIVADSQFDLNAFIQRRAGRAIALKTNTDFVVGDGSGKPRGITNNTAGVTLSTGQTLLITSPDSIIDLYHSLAVPYRGGAVFIMHDSILKQIRKFKELTSGGNQYLWQPGLTAGAPDTILGRPVYIDPDMPVAAANAKTIYFGDVKANYIVRSVTGVSLKVLTELYAANGYVGFRVDRRVDGDIQDTSAARLLVMSAT
jgi:HK97 family phage major capsid protein